MKRLKERFLVVVATSFGLGYVPVAPGTFGALPGVAMFLAIMAWTPAEATWLHTGLIAACLVVVCWATLALSPWAEAYWKKKDPGTFVTDEVAGFLATVVLFRRGDLLGLTLWAFLVTRVFDIIKVPPAKQFERIHGGWGILLDDLMASVYAAAFLHGLYLLFPQVMHLQQQL